MTAEHEYYEDRAPARQPEQIYSLRTEESEQLAELYAALSKAQGAMTAAAKDSKNPHFGSKFADLASIWAACRKPLADNGLCVIQAPVRSPSGQQLELKTTLAHASGQWVRSYYPITPMKNDAQGIGSAITYAKRYSLSALVGVVSEDEDDDGERAQGRGGNGFDALEKRPPQQQPEQPKAPPKKAALPPLPDKITHVPPEIIAIVPAWKALIAVPINMMVLEDLEVLQEHARRLRALPMVSPEGKAWMLAIETTAKHRQGEVEAIAALNEVQP